MSIRYRPEIDGLRAVAVLPVILYHAGFSTFSGGYVGVDVFFVISGFLITSIIATQLQTKKFRLSEFYERRAKRLLPALGVVLFSCLIFAHFFVEGEHRVGLGKSGIATLLFVSNIFFWKTTNYFDTHADLKPLLHTWSLSVEEQFYLVFPVLLIATWRFGLRKVGAILVCATVSSFALAEYASKHHAVGNFYLLPTRAWELLAGALLALRMEEREQRPASSLLAWLGLGLITGSVILFEPTIPFPSVWTLVPVWGTVLLLKNAQASNTVGRLLSQRFLVQVGLISYSAYLWHQPLFAFARVFKNKATLGIRIPLETPEVPLKVGLIIGTFILAYATWRWVEQPVRNSRKSKSSRPTQNWLIQVIIYNAGFTILFFALIKTDTQLPTSIRTTWDKQVRLHECHLQDMNASNHSAHCIHNKKDILIWGDSHAASLSSGISEWASQNDLGFSQLTQSGCAPLIGLQKLKKVPKCSEINERILKIIEANQFRHVILHAAWVYSTYSMDGAKLEALLSRTIERIKQKSPQTVISVIGTIPRYSGGPLNTGIDQKFDDKLFSYSAITLTETDAVLRRLDDVPDVGVTIPRKHLCRLFGVKEACLIGFGPSEGQNSLPYEQYAYVDFGHLSTRGARHLAAIIMDRVYPLGSRE